MTPVKSGVRFGSRDHVTVFTIPLVYNPEDFPNALIRTKANRHPKYRYQFGILLSSKTLQQYAVDRQLVAADYIRTPIFALCAIERAILHLRTLVEHEVLLDDKHSDASLGHDHLILSLYSNYDYIYRHDKDRDQDMINTIQRELSTSESPKWYWDWANLYPDAARYGNV
ncbi:hypothetical protein GGX14DRAFT_387083 [Mycena pura]|uniref:Uncharacterized protein n=1 Tax=Mycena pura TaxID=153505 RepID=A0AAD6YNC9_9AGAR|nr:hypothetical protein GGX14DRAFT_387083 [Mycena pura]